MKKVICISTGKQTDGLQVVVGETYTVIGTATGGDVAMYHRANDIFYLLAEMGNERVFWSELFTDISENEVALEKEAKELYV